MKKQSGKQRLLDVGCRLVHSAGFAGASVRDITQAAGMPLGSFSNHFATKEQFGLEVLDLYAGRYGEILRSRLDDRSAPPLARLGRFVDAIREMIEADDWKAGCMIGNFAAEIGDRSEPIRARIRDIFARVRERIERCLREAVDAGELDPGSDCGLLADFFFESFQGAILRAKVERDPGPIERFRAVMFGAVLRRPGP